MRRFLVLTTDSTAVAHDLNDGDAEMQALDALQQHVGAHIQLLPGGHLRGKNSTWTRTR